MSHIRKNIFLLITITLLAIAVTGYYFYSKEGINVKKAEATEVGAVQLYDAFIKDSINSTKKFTENILLVTGEVKLVSYNQQNQLLVMLKTNTESASVNCTFEGKPVNIKVGAIVSIKGICKGIGESNADLVIPADVYITRCYLEK